LKIPVYREWVRNEHFNSSPGPFSYTKERGEIIVVLWGFKIKLLSY
jgi:hypothetical protein